MASSPPGIQPQLSEAALEHSQGATVQLPRLQQILLCTDFTLVSETSTAAAIDLCKRTGAKLWVLHVREYGPTPARTEKEASSIAERLRQEEARIKEVIDRIRMEGISAEGLVETGHPPISIVEFIASRQPDLAIVGTKGINGLERMMFGSTAEAVLRHSICPVMVVGPRVTGEQRSGPVVFATDFHEPAKQAANYASALAQAKPDSLHCLHVLPLSADHGVSGILQFIVKEALRELAGNAQISPSDVTFHIVYDSEVSHGVVDYAKEHNARFIVLGVRRGPILSSHLPPHLTYKMIVTAPCPVLTISLLAARHAAKSLRSPM